MASMIAIALTRTGADGFTLTDEGTVRNREGKDFPSMTMTGDANDGPGFAEDREAMPIDEKELAEHAPTLEGDARFAVPLANAEVGGNEVVRLPGTEDDVAFLWAFPSRVLEGLSC